MGELVVGTPTVRLSNLVSVPLDLVAYMSLLYRGVPGSGLTSDIIATRRALSDDLRADLDLLHGFSGRLLYYMEEPSMRFDPLRPDRIDASADDLFAFLQDLPAGEFQNMALHALDRVHQDLQSGLTSPPIANADAWRLYLLPALTTASPEEAYALIADPDLLKQKTVGLMSGVWEAGLAQVYEERRSELEHAAALAMTTTSQGFGLAFTELTGNRLPATLAGRLGEVERVAFVPSLFLGAFVSYILYPSDLVVYYGAPEFIARTHDLRHNGSWQAPQEPRSTVLSDQTLLDALRALGDQNRLRIVDLLTAGELYAQEIVGRLGIAQSAVSRHLSLLERAGVIRVKPRGGMKYYALNQEQLEAIARALRSRSETAGS